MNSTLKFKESTDIYSPVYFHFLDGLISDEGAEINQVLLTLKNISKINLDEILIIKDKDDLHEKFKFENIKNKPDEFFFKNKETYKKDLNFCIIPVGYNQHLTTTIIFIKNFKMYLYILNTGLDINQNGESKLIDGGKIINQLTKGIEICNNIRNDNKFHEGLLFIKNFIHIGVMYNFIKNKEYSENRDKTKLGVYKFNKFSCDKVLKKFEKIVSNSELNKSKIFSLNNIKMNITNLIKNIDDTKYNNNNFLDIVDRYYIIVSKFIDEYNPINMDVFNIGQYGISSLDELKTEKQLNDNFLRKIIIYHQNSNLYICMVFYVFFNIIFFYNS